MLGSLGIMSIQNVFRPGQVQTDSLGSTATSEAENYMASRIFNRNPRQTQTKSDHALRMLALKPQQADGSVDDDSNDSGGLLRSQSPFAMRKNARFVIHCEMISETSLAKHRCHMQTVTRCHARCSGQAAIHWVRRLFQRAQTVLGRL